jgi:hypothetical protein
MERTQNQGLEVNSGKMLDFAEWLACYGIWFSDNANYEEQRMAVVLLDQSMEIMMKTFLISKGYEVFYFKEKDLVKGLKKLESSDKMFTVDFIPVLDIVKKELQNIDAESIKHFHEIRNKVYHGAAVTLRENKLDEMAKYIPKLEQFYNSAFPQRSFSINVKGKLPNITSRINQKA